MLQALSTVRPVPTHRELAALTPSRTLNTVQRDLRWLETHGFIARSAGKARAVRVLLPLVTGVLRPVTQGNAPMFDDQAPTEPGCTHCASETPEIATHA